MQRLHVSFFDGVGMLSISFEGEVVEGGVDGLYHLMTEDIEMTGDVFEFGVSYIVNFNAEGVSIYRMPAAAQCFDRHHVLNLCKFIRGLYPTEESTWTDLPDTYKPG